MCVFNLKKTCIKCPKKTCTEKNVTWEQLRAIATLENSMDIFKHENPYHKADAKLPDPYRIVNLSHSDKEQWRVHKGEIEQAMVADILLIMDLTGSMRRWMKEAYKRLEEIIKNIKKKMKKYKIRFAFVGYRDIENGKDRVAFKDFTEDISSISSCIRLQ